MKQQQHQFATPNDTQSFIVLLIGALLIGFGTTMLLISLTYVQDVAMLRQTPEAVWLFICGVPTENPLVFPALITFGVPTLLIGIALVGYGIYREKRHNVVRT